MPGETVQSDMPVMNQPQDGSQLAGEASDSRLRKMELLIGRLLRIGVVGSLVIVVIGAVLSFAHHPQYMSSTADLAPLLHAPAGAVGPEAPNFPHTLTEVFGGLIHLRGQAVVMTGLLLLIATPVLRVVVSIIVFARQKDRPFVIITTTVLVLLIISFLLGKIMGKVG